MGVLGYQQPHPGNPVGGRRIPIPPCPNLSINRRRPQSAGQSFRDFPGRPVAFVIVHQRQKNGAFAGSRQRFDKFLLPRRNPPQLKENHQPQVGQSIAPAAIPYPFRRRSCQVLGLGIVTGRKLPKGGFNLQYLPAQLAAASAPRRLFRRGELRQFPYRRLQRPVGSGMVALFPQQAVRLTYRLPQGLAFHQGRQRPPPLRCQPRPAQ